MKPRNRNLLAVIDSGDVRRYRGRRVEAKPRKLQHNRARRRTAERKEQENEMTPETLFQAALAKIDSASIRAWAQTSNNRPIMLKLAAIQLASPSTDPVHLFAAFIVAKAIDL